MRPFLRKAGLALALGSLVFWFSCERHHAGELTGESETPAQEHAQSDQPTATTHTSHTSQSPAPRNSPANFFPEKKKP